MTGTIVNAAAVVAGGLIGLMVKKSIKQSLSDTCMRVIGLATLLIGISNALSYMLSIDDSGKISADGGLLLLISIIVGTVIGELLNIEGFIMRISAFAERKLKMNGFANGFVTSSLLFCVGAMAIVGAFNDGLNNDPSMLFIKSAMDGVSAVFLASSLGVGVLFSCIPLLLYQGSLTLCAGMLAPVLTGDMLSGMCMVGFVMIIAISLNLMNVTKFKTANMLPSLIVVVLLKLLPWF
ncbi:MAG: DUF554 domain-containing protein [Oscillospiraceae bacterium]